MIKEKQFQVILQELQKENSDALLRNIAIDFTVGDLKELLQRAMLKQYSILDGPLTDWKIRDTQRHYFKGFLQSEINK